MTPSISCRSTTYLESLQCTLKNIKIGRIWLSVVFATTIIITCPLPRNHTPHLLEYLSKGDFWKNTNSWVTSPIIIDFISRELVSSLKILWIFKKCFRIFTVKTCHISSLEFSQRWGLVTFPSHMLLAHPVFSQPSA